MSNRIISLGKCSKYYLYILGTIFFRCLKDCIFGFVAIDPESKIGLFGFIPKISGHYLLQDFYKYLSFIFGGLIFSKILKKKSKNSERPPVKKNTSFKLKDIKGLIYHKNDIDNKNISLFKILLICSIFCFHLEISRIMYLLDFNGLDFWIFDIGFTILFIDIYFIINYYKHQRYSMIFVICIDAILLLISSFLPNTNNKNDTLKDKNTYQIIEDITGSKYSFIFILIIFTILSALLSFGRVKIKILMYFNYISPYKIIYYIGIIGSIMTFISLIFVTLFNCKKIENIQNYCVIEKGNNYYYDNIIIYLNNLLDDMKNYKIYVEILIIIPLFFALEFFAFTCEILTIYYLNPLYVLIRENLYYCVLRFVFILLNLDNYGEYMTLAQFLILQASEIIALMGYAVYLEIIELNFCGLDKDLRRKIIERGQKEALRKPLDDNNDIDNNSNEDNNEYNTNDDIENEDVENKDNSFDEKKDDGNNDSYNKEEIEIV